MGSRPCDNLGIFNRRALALGRRIAGFSVCLCESDFGTFVGVIWFFDTAFSEYTAEVSILQPRHGRIDGAFGAASIP